MKLSALQNLASFLFPLLLTAVVCLTIFCAVSYGYQELIPELRLQSTYDDNIIFSYHKPVSDWIFEAFPSLKWRYVTERNLLEIKAGLRGQRYASEDDLNTIDQDYRINAKAALSERLDFGLTGRLALDTTQEDEFTEEGLLLYRRDRVLYSAQPEIKWAATEKTNLSLSFPIYHVNYDGSENVDYNSEYAVFTVEHLLDDNKTTIFLRPSIGTANFENGNSLFYDFMAGVGRNFSERLYISLMFGVNHTYSNLRVWKVRPLFGNVFTFIREKESFSDTGFISDGSLTWKWERGSLKANFGRRVSASGYGEPVTRDRLTTGLSWTLTQRMRFKVSASITRTQSESSYVDRDELSYYLRPAIFYRLTEHIDVGLSYRYNRIENRDSSDSADRNRVMFFIYFRNLKKIF